MIHSEVVFTIFLNKNVPLAVAHDSGELCQSMTLKSEELGKYSCVRIKTIAVVHEIAKQKKEETLSGVSSKVYLVATDGGNDADSKLFLV